MTVEMSRVTSSKSLSPARLTPSPDRKSVLLIDAVRWRTRGVSWPADSTLRLLRPRLSPGRPSGIWIEVGISRRASDDDGGWPSRLLRRRTSLAARTRSLLALLAWTVGSRTWTSSTMPSRESETNECVDRGRDLALTNANATGGRENGGAVSSVWPCASGTHRCGRRQGLASRWADQRTGTRPRLRTTRSRAARQRHCTGPRVARSSS